MSGLGSLWKMGNKLKRVRKTDMQKQSVEFKHEMGCTLRDKVTGLEGIIMVRAEYFSGCHHYALSPAKTDKDGSGVPDWVWLDQSRLEPVEKEAMTFSVNRSKPSGDFPSGPSM